MNFSLYNIIVLILVMSLIWIPWLWRYKIKPYVVSSELHKELKQYPHWKELIKTERFLRELYKGINTAWISQRERKRLNIDDDAFIYGEIEFLPFYTILEKVKPQANEIFYDLGSGAGKAVFVAASFFSISKAYGVELLPGLYKLANSQVARAQELVKVHPQKMADIEFIQDNFLNCDISNGDIIFINATCLSYPSWEKLFVKLVQLKKGSRIIVTSKKIQHESFAVISQTFEVMSWGVNSVNIYQKIS